MTGTTQPQPPTPLEPDDPEPGAERAELDADTLPLPLPLAELALDPDDVPTLVMPLMQPQVPPPLPPGIPHHAVDAADVDVDVVAVTRWGTAPLAPPDVQVRIAAAREDHDAQVQRLARLMHAQHVLVLQLLEQAEQYRARVLVLASRPAPMRTPADMARLDALRRDLEVLEAAIERVSAAREAHEREYAQHVAAVKALTQALGER